jgi:hypothetical protein
MSSRDEEIKSLMMKIVDGVATPEDQRQFEEAAKDDPALETELRAFRKIKEVTDQMQYKEMPDSYWEGYWANVYRRTERAAGWIFLSVGAVILLASFLFFGMWSFFFDPNVPIAIKLGIGIGGLGLIIMIVSVLRERLFARHRDRYEREVQR